MHIIRISLKLGGLVLAGYLIWLFFKKPTNDADWTVDQAILPDISIEGNIVQIKHIRNFTYKSTTDYIPNYYDKIFDVRKIKKVYFVMEPFVGHPEAAHTFLSFEFENNSFVAISIEIRKKKDQSFSAWKGLFNQYELTYMIADERDVVKLRSNFRHDWVYVYPIKASAESVGKLFMSIVKRAKALAEKPEFYNTLFNSCTTNIVSHVNEIDPGRISWWSPAIYFPAASDKLIYDLGLIDTNLSFEEAQAHFNINAHALKYANDPLFSVKIRE